MNRQDPGRRFVSKSTLDGVHRPPSLERSLLLSLFDISHLRMSALDWML